MIRFIRIASFLPEGILRWLDRHVPYHTGIESTGKGRDPVDGWTIWTDASYHRYCRLRGER